jgi:type IV secretory pathway VirB10-like protein
VKTTRSFLNLSLKEFFMLKQVKLLATIGCIAVMLAACGDKEDKAKTTVAETTTTVTATTVTTPAEPAKPAETSTTTPAAPATTEPAATATPAPATSADAATDLFAYCETTGTIDKADANYKGEAVPAKLVDAIAKAGIAAADMPQLKEPGFVNWRCMDKKVYVCLVGANIPCYAKLNTSKEPNEGMKAFCTANANSDSIPASDAGRDTAFNWSCKDGQPQAGEQLMQADAQGYPTSLWTQVNP